MNKQEMYLLLELLMFDMRMDFPQERKDYRLQKAIELADSLKLHGLYEQIREWSFNSYLDGRFFRDIDMNYNRINQYHNLETTYRDKSLQFLDEAICLHAKEYIFSDYTTDSDYRQQIIKRLIYNDS